MIDEHVQASWHELEKDHGRHGVVDTVKPSMN